MAEITLEALQKLFEATKDPALGTFIQTMEAAGRSVTTLGEVASRVSPDIVSRLGSIGEAAEKAAKNFGEFGGIAKQVAEAGTGLWNMMTGHIDEFIQREKDAGKGMLELGIQTGLVMEPLVGVLPKGVTGMGDLGKAGYDAGQTISESFQPIGAMLTTLGVPAKLVEGFQRMSDGATRAYGLQKELIALAAAQGNLSAVTENMGGSFTDMNALMTQMSTLSFDSAEATGQTVGAMMNLAKALGTIPDALTAPIEVGGRYMNQMVATSQIATAFGRKQSEVATQLGEVYTTMGLRGQEAFEVISGLYEAAADSKLRFEAFNKSVMDIAGSFKMLGDNTEAATNVVRAFDTAFKTSDISPAAMQEVIAGLTSGVRDMERGTQAFIAAQTGGPGGLAGAFEIELAMQEGRMDEVLSRTMTAMQAQFGGEVLTLRDAASNPALAGEFYKQVQYLTQVAGVAKSDREAYRILEAMQSGVMDMLQPGAAGTERAESLETASMRGAEEQARTTSEVMKVHREMERASLFQSRQLGVLNSSLNEQTRMATRMAEMADIASTRGIGALGTTEEVRGMVGPAATEFDYLRRVAALAREDGPLGKLFTSVAALGERAEREGGAARTAEAATPMTEEERTRRAMATPVGAGIAPGAVAPPPPPGAAAGMGALPGGPRAPVGALPRPGMPGAGMGTVSAIEAYERGLPINVSHDPIEISIDLGPMFEKKIQTVAEAEAKKAVGEAASKTNKQAGLGTGS